MMAVIDNLSNSSIDTLNNVKKIISKILTFEIDLLITRICKGIQKGIPNVITHGIKILSESVSFPLRYYKNNIKLLIFWN